MREGHLEAGWGYTDDTRDQPDGDFSYHNFIEKCCEDNSQSSMTDYADEPIDLESDSDGSVKVIPNDEVCNRCGVNKRTDLWTQIDKNIFPYLASCKSYERVANREYVQTILCAPDSILQSDERGAEWFFKQENEWALADVLEKITKVQGQFRGVLLRKQSTKTLSA